MRKYFGLFALFAVVLATGCDLQPKIASIPDSIGDFISERYPALLAEPDSDIYKTAVADYGVYASPTDYGNGDMSEEDYVLYSPTDDYMMPAQDTDVASEDVGMPDDEDEPTENDDTDVSEYTPDEHVDDLKIPDYVNEKPVEKPIEQAPEKTKPESKPKSENKSEPEKKPEMVRAQVREITVEKGDTLYSLSRKYSVPVNDLAVMNKISAPFALSVGQKLKVPDVLSVPQRAATVAKTEPVKQVAKPVEKKAETVTAPEQKKTETKVVADKKEQTKTSEKTKAPTAKPEVKKTTEPVKPVAAVPADKKATKPVAPVKTEVKKDVKKTEVKKDTKKAEPKKTDAKKTTTVKKTEQKKTETKKAEKQPQKIAQKSEPKKRATKQLAARSSSKFSWPVRGRILSGYGSKTNGLFNDGINIQAARGATVSASENGFVAYAGNEVKGMGNLVIIQHADGWMTVYAHMNSMVVRRGSTVLVGQKIGTVGTSGKVDKPQLHFEIRKGTKAYNPVNYLKK